jgi:hypothetical protein
LEVEVMNSPGLRPGDLGVPRWWFLTRYNAKICLELNNTPKKVQLDVLKNYFRNIKQQTKWGC